MPMKTLSRLDPFLFFYLGICMPLANISPCLFLEKKKVCLIVYGFIIQGLNDLPPVCLNGVVDDVLEASTSNHSRMQNLTAVNYSPKLEFIDGDVDDDLDPAMKEELDRQIHSSFGIEGNNSAYLPVLKIEKFVSSMLEKRKLCLTPIVSHVVLPLASIGYGISSCSSLC